VEKILFAWGMTVILEDEKNASLSQSEGYVDVGYVGGLD